MKCLLLGVFCVLAVGCEGTSSPSGDRTTSQQASPSARPTAGPGESGDRTNTGVNTRDRDSAALTPTDQKENQADVTTTADIRKRVIDAEMSVEAQNIKIITRDGKVTLRGPVATEQEKQKIADIAKNVAGAGNVDNQLEVGNK